MFGLEKIKDLLLNKFDKVLKDVSLQIGNIPKLLLLILLFNERFDKNEKQLFKL